MLPKITLRIVLIVGNMLLLGFLSKTHAQYCEPNLRWLNHLRFHSLNEEIRLFSECADKSNASDTFKFVMADWLRKQGESNLATQWYQALQGPDFLRVKGLSLVRLNASASMKMEDFFKNYPISVSKEDSQFIGINLDYYQLIAKLNNREQPFALMDSMTSKLATHHSEFSRQIADANFNLMKMNYPSLGKATLLALIPGLGKWYVGRKGEALASLLVISLFTVTTIELSHQMGLTHILTLTAGLGGLVFYWGGILGTRRSVRSVWNRNKSTYEETANRLLDAQLDALLRPGNQ